MTYCRYITYRELLLTLEIVIDIDNYYWGLLLTQGAIADIEDYSSR